MALNPEDLEKMQAEIEKLASSPATDELKKTLGKEIGALNGRIERDKLRKIPWDGLTIGQKLERMREIVKEIERTLQWHSRSVQELREQISTLQGHSHIDGVVMIPLLTKHGREVYGAEAAGKMVDGYF